MSMLTVEECELLSDSKYRSYISQVDKALKSFEYTSEWADLISALGKLNKVLLSHIKYPVIPKKVTIGKRLAQCLHPALPGGVHLKALETYDIIFRCIGTQRLAQDLFVYSAGLFPLLNHAAMSVKPELFNIYEKHFVALGKHIKPGLNGLLIGLLPGLEEGAEFYDKANVLLESFCDAVEKEFFYTCMWECVLSCPSVRLPAITFLLSHFNKKKSMEDQLHMMGFNIDLMVQALSSSIQDTSVLVQRISLDFLLLGFPMHNGQLTKSDTAKIVQGAINVVLRRDMSLNRRLYGWLLGTSASGLSSSVADNNRRGRVDSTSTSSEMDLGYFHQFSKDLLVQAIKMKLANPEDNEMSVGGISNLMKPFRIIISLLDKPEIGPVIIDSVLMSVFRCLYKECNTNKPEQKVKVKNKSLKRQDSTQEKTQSAELIKTANLLFGSFEPYFIWDYLGRMFNVACSNVHQRVELDNHDSVQVIELCEIGEFLLDIISLEIYQETQTEHLPELLRHVISAVTTNCSALTECEITATLKLCSKIFSKVEPSVTVMDFESQDPEVTSVCGEMFEDVFKMKKEQERKEECHIETDIAQSSEKGHNPAESSNKEIKDLKSESVNDNSKSTEKLLKSETNEENNDQEEYKECKSSLDPEDKGETYFSAEDSPVKKPKVVEDGVKDVKSSENSESEQTQNPEVSKTDNTSQENKKRTLLKSISTDSRNHKNSVPLSVMQTCIHSFKELFHTLICDKILKGFTISDKCMEALITQTDNTRSSDKDSVLDSNSTSGLEDFGSRDLSAIEKLKILPEGLSEASYEAFEKACRLLVDFASFPLFCTDFNKLIGQAMDDENEYSLPDWLQDLITCSCFIKKFEIQTAAISTILDLINLTQSVQTESECKCQVSNRSRSMSEGRISVVILPALLPCHLKFMNENTLFFQVCANELWQHLGEKTSSRHRRSVELFHFLHQVSPSSWICEDTIGSSLVASDEKTRIESFKRFTIMWHLTRELKLDVKPGAGTRSFDRSMFVVLDSLKEESGATKTIATTWLTHCVQRGDISRVLQPILLMLLQPDTARISVQHVNIHQPRKVKISESGEDDDIEAKIYAISSEGGNVIYHVSPDGKKFSQKATEELKSCAMAVTNDNGSAMTASVRSPTESELSFERVNPEYLKLRVNPFGSEHSLDKLIYDDVHVHLPTRAPDLGNVKRLDKTTCRKEGIFFDNEDANEALEKSEISSEEMVSQILEDLIAKVVEQGEYSKLQKKRDSERTDSISRYSQLGDQDLLNAIDKRGMEMDSLSGSDTDVSKSAQDTKDKDTTGIHTLHMHLLLYSQKYDYERTLYALSTLKAMLTMCPRLIVTALATTSISSMNPIQLTNLQLLLARHRKSVFGKNFFGEIQPEVLSSYRSNMILEIFISLCLYYIRSYYPNLMVSKLSAEELAGNKDVHIMATEILTLLMSELISIVHESGKSFTSYITDLLTKCKLQKALLHCMLASVYNSRQKTEAENKSKITEAIVSFNEDCLEGSANETFQIKLLKLLLVMIMLESRMYTSNNEETTPPSTAEWDRTKVTFQSSILNVHYSAVQPIVQQGMFLSGVLSALKQHHMSHLHRHWIAMVTSSLPYMGKALSRVVIAVVSQLCRNLEILSAEFESKKRTVRLTKVPPDHLLTMLEGLTAICHYCLLDNASPVSIGLPAPTITNISTETASTGQILSNLINVFNPIQNNRETSPIRDNTALSPVLEARRGLLSILPRIMACMAVMWKALNTVTSGEIDRYTQARLTMGSPKIVRQHILEFLSPISLPHGTNLLGAVAVAWNDRRKKIQGIVKKVVPVPCEDQLLLVELVSAIKVLPTDTLIQTIKQVLKQPPPTELTNNKRGVTIEVNMLQFFYSYVEEISPYQLMDSWPSFLTLMKESLQLNLLAPGQFLLLEILSEFVQKMPTMEDKKQLKELQDITQKLLEAVAYIAGSSLQQTTWLRRNLAVKPGPQNEVQELEDGDITEDSEPESDVEKRVVEKVVVEAHLNQAANSKYSVQALTLLAELTAPLLDVVYGSDEKDKISPFISTLLCNVFPYLKSHSCHNLPSFRASSQILSSISGYQYTRKSWRKEALEFLLDQGFFQMDLKCIRYWRSVIDNLMTHDKTTFKDLLSRVVMTPSGSLNLFSSKEQEYEQRAQMLKRLSFTIFCSDRDQYQRNMPDIQERLAESLKVPQVPSVQAQVFLCFRVLILRMTSHQLTSLWPTIITEMVHVCLQMEQELSTETDEFKTQLQRIAALDSSWAHLGNGLNAHNNPAWLQLYLSVCKLLDLCLALPADTVPQFQLYRWAFIGAAAGEDDDESIKDKRILPPSFVPHIVRLSKLLNLRLQREPALLKRIPGRPLLTMTYLRSLVELQPFFNTLCHASQSEKNYQTPGGVVNTMPKSQSAPIFDELTASYVHDWQSDLPKSNRQFIEELVERDFLDLMS